jgi:hypothetical protein
MFDAKLQDMGELLVVKSRILNEKTTHVVVCDRCCDVVVEHASGVSNRNVTFFAALRHQEKSFFRKHDLYTYIVKTKRMTEGVDLESNLTQ